jgi:predicted nucleic acid-binding protein
MRYLLDSDRLSDLYATDVPGHAGIARRLASLGDSDHVVLSILALYELEYGCANAPEEKKLVLRQRISAAQADFAVLPLTAESAQVYASLKVGLRRSRQLSGKGIKMHNIDLMLAAAAITEDCVLLSGDSLFRDLQQLDPRLRFEESFDS